MNDPPAPVQAENNPQPEVNNNANNDQPPPQPRRNIYNFGPVKLQWEDFLSALDELSHINKLPKTGQPLDILSLGCSTISKGRDQPGRIVTIDVEMTNLQPKIEGKIRLVEKILRICSTFLRQDPEGVAGQVFDICANAMIEIYQSNSSFIQTLQPFYWRELMSTIKYSVDENKELGAGMRLGLCNIIADLEETEQSSKAKLHEENVLTQYLREVTHNEREQIELMQKIALLLPPDEVSAADNALMEALREQPQHRSYTVDELTKLFEALFSEVSVGLLDGTLDVLIALSRRVTCALDILELGSSIKASILAGLSEESDRVIVFAKLMELLRVLIFCNMSTQRITEVFTDLVPASIKALESIKNTSDFSQKTICKMIELYCLAAERDLDLTDVSREILPNIINTSSKVDDKDAVLKELFNYASFAWCSKDPVSFLKSGLNSVFYFVRSGLGEEFVNDSEVVCTCLELASLFIRQKAEPQGLLSFFEIQMTSSFEVPAKWDCDDQAFKRLTLLDVLKQGLIVIQNGINRYKYFIFYMPPIYTMIEELPIDHFLKKAGNPAEKSHVHRRRMELLREIVQILIEEVKKGNDISILLSDALPMVFELYGRNKYALEALDQQQEGQTAEQQPTESGVDALTAAPAKRSLRTAQRVPVEGEAKSGLNRDATHEIINRLRFVIVKYESNNDYALLLLLKSCYDFALRNFHFFNPRKIGEVFRNLLDKGQRDHLKGFIRICNSELNDEKYQSIRNYIFGDAGLSSRNFEELCKVLAMIFDLRKFQNEAVNKIIVRIVASLEECLINNSFTVEMTKDLTERINRLILFKNLFGDELEKNKDKTAEELNEIFQSKFPQDMVQDEFMMNLLTSLSLRIERIAFALPKWKHVADFTVDLLNKFFAIELPNDPALSTNEAKIKYRREILDKMVYDLPKTQEMRKYLAALGYSESLWEKDVWLDVEVDDRKNIEENFKASLIGIYGEYVDIYKTLYPNSDKINIDGREFELDRVFADDRENTTIDDLKSRRNVFLKAIDKRIKNHPRKAFIVNRKLSLLTREDQIEADVEQQKLQEKLEPAQKRRYWCRFNNTFVNSAYCCGKNIVGCYAPDGDHAEKPIENSLKANLGFISVYDTEGATPMSHEIENAEVLFTDQGLFIYKIYTNGHSYDTSLVWTSMFKALVESGLVPAIIIPRGFPNNRTFGLFESMIPTELVGGIITYKDDFFEEAGVESYFDFKAAKIQPGDVILTDKNVHLLKLPDLSVADQRKGKTLLRRSTGTLAVNKDNKAKPKAYNSIRKDLAGVVMTRVILKLKADSNSQLSENVEAFARFLSQYITLYIEFGVRDFEILTVGFDLDQYIKRKGKKKGKKPMTKEEKEALIKRILQIIHAEIESLFESPAKLKSLFARNKEQFFELQQHLLQVVKNLHRDLASVKAGIQHTRLAQQRQRNVMQQGANNEAQQPGDGQQTGPEIKADNKETAQITMTEEEIKLEQEKAEKALSEIKNVLKKSTVTVRISDLRPQMQIFAMKWIFGNEDRVWRDRGGRPGEETLQSFINFVTVPKPGQPVQPSPTTNNATAPSTSSNSEQSPPQANSNPEEDEDDEPKDEFSRSEMRLDHYGNAPFGGFIEFTRKSLPPTDDKARDDVDNESLAHFGFTNLNIFELDTLEKVDIVGYCIGDYIEKDNFEVVTAWVHPAFRSIGVAWKLYEITIEEIHRRGGKYMTYDILQGSLERVIRSSPVLSICRMLGITDLCVVKRRKSYANQTSMGTEEQFERIRANVKWILMGKKALDAKRKAGVLVQKLKFWKLKHVSHDDKFEGILGVL